LFSSRLERLRALLGPGGSLAQTWPGYERRPGQLAMAEKVLGAFCLEDVALVEAGTGTGKTLAYLLPALLCGRKTVVSTRTKNLQEQIFEKDIPFIQRWLGGGFKAAALKGRENYLCLRRFKTFLREPIFQTPGEAFYLEALTRWAETTTTGDRATLAELPEDFTTWSDLSASAEQCLGGKCPEHGECFLQRARRAAAAADLVVVNHHLFMADLAVRQSGHGEVIPDYEAAVFDEAHQVEEVATQYFGLAVSSWRLNELRRDVEAALRQAGGAGPELVQLLTWLRHQADALALRFFAEEGEFELWTDDGGSVMDELRAFGLRLSAQMGRLASLLEARAAKEEALEGLPERARAVGHDLDFILEGRDRSYVYYAERRKGGLFLRASPIAVGPLLQERLYRPGLPLVFTSATLATNGVFDHIKERLGLLPEIEGLVVPSPFDFERQSLLYVPGSMPPPQHADYPEALTQEIEALLALSRGRAFVLFTSYRNLRYVSERLLGRLPWPCLIQGEAPRSALLDRFRTQAGSVLFATQSFWEGVDVPGENLSAVIIDKLPFAPPDRPLIKARLERLREEGQDPFFAYQVPEAVISLKQGLGRLLRTQTDRGLLAVLDARLVNRGYGKMFLRSLPNSPLTRDKRRVAEFFGRL
jgi:ATP-dependent DNA helicase DinG